MNKHYRYRRRRGRGVYISPLPLLAVGALAVVLGVFLVSRALGGAEPESPDGAQPPEPPVSQDGGGADRPRQLTTASGIACTLTELGEEAVYTGDLILVNNWTPFHFPADQASQLMCVLENKSGSYYVRDATVYLLPQALDALNRMLDDFQSQGGSKSVNVVAGHRTAEFQQHLFDQSVERNGQEHAEKYVAKPGGSEHHTGLVVDFSLFYSDGSSAEYNGSGEYAWINANCRNYGYVVRYETGKEALTGIWDEPWHFRYIGVPHAAQAAEQGLCLEEYIDYLKQFPFEGEHLTIQCAEGTYEAWYTRGTEVYLPDSGEYAVSGNNVDGVIVTCKIG